MKRSFSIFFLTLAVFAFNSTLTAQKRNLPRKPKTSAVVKKIVIVDERLAVLRASPSLYAKPIQRLRRGRDFVVSDSREADGVNFYKINLSAKNSGWIQTDAVVGNFQNGDDERLMRLIQASDGFDLIERATIFLENFPKSPLRPPILLLFGDLMEENALQLSKDAARRLNRREMAASGAPLHSFYLNFTSLDRYRRLGTVFLFNAATKNFHYDGATWNELIKKYPKSPEAVEAQKRLDSLREKLERQAETKK